MLAVASLYRFISHVNFITWIYYAADLMGIFVLQNTVGGYAVLFCPILFLNHMKWARPQSH